MSNPSINRWGYNLFWYRNWYSEKFKSQNIQQDYIFNKLIYCYLFYGFYFPRNIFVLRYWKKKYQFFEYQHQKTNESYFRTYDMYDEFLLKKYKTRIRTKFHHIYYSIIWIFKYQNWIFINFYSLNPIYKKKKTKKLKKKLFCANKRFQPNSLFFKRIFFNYYSIFKLKKNHYLF